MSKKISETNTENIFRKHYGAGKFIEKSAIPNGYGFKSKKGTSYKGYPDFFLEVPDYCIVVEAKAEDHDAAEEETQFYMINNKIKKDIIGIAVSGQKKSALRVSYYLRKLSDLKIEALPEKDTLITLEDINKSYKKNKYATNVSAEQLMTVLQKLSKRFEKDKTIRNTERALFFSGIMIALKNNNFRNTYQNIQAPTKSDLSTTKATVLESVYLNNAIVEAIDKELSTKVNSLSKEYSWKDKFSFIKNIDYPLADYKDIITTIECEIFYPFQNDEKLDILGRAYRIFLKNSGKIENKNIIITPDHIKSLMVKLARLNQDDVVLDTCTGTGGFLMESMETMVDLASGDVKKIKHIKEKQLIGFEVDSVLFALSCSNMFLHGDGRTNLLYRSSLLEDRAVVGKSDKDILKYIKKMKPTKVLINPPYESNASIKFVLQGIDYLEPNGKMIVIMPTPTLTQNQGGLTEKLLGVAKLDFVIKMPTKLFTDQGRTVNTSIFGFTKTPHGTNDDVLYYSMDDDGFVSIQHKGRVDTQGKWDKIESHVLDCVLNCKEAKGVCVKKKIYKKGELNCSGFQRKKSSTYKSLKIGKLFNIEAGSLQSSKCNDGIYPFVTASDEWKTHDEYTHDCEALVYAFGAGGSLGKCQYVNNGKFIASDLCWILTPKNPKKYPINLKFYNYYFASIREQLVSDLADGTSKLTISDKAFEDYYIDYVPEPEQELFVNTKVAAFLKIKEDYQKAEEKFLKEVENLI